MLAGGGRQRCIVAELDLFLGGCHGKWRSQEPVQDPRGATRFNPDPGHVGSARSQERYGRFADCHLRPGLRQQVAGRGAAGHEEGRREVPGVRGHHNGACPDRDLERVGSLQ
ncbi:MAG: hypothetical protein UT91_C0030G0014, partial [Parcubacteria group bacterium GW2011_GWA2_40_23]